MAAGRPVLTLGQRVPTTAMQRVAAIRDAEMVGVRFQHRQTYAIDPVQPVSPTKWLARKRSLDTVEGNARSCPIQSLALYYSITESSRSNPGFNGPRTAQN